jgi:hypothetical protein
LVATNTLTYIYADSTAVLGPLSTFSEPHAFDLCDNHAQRLTVPKGWTVIQHQCEENNHEPTAEDLIAIADAVRGVAKVEVVRKPMQPEIGRRGHLRAIPNQD